MSLSAYQDTMMILDTLDRMMILDLERNGSRYAIGSSAFATGACLRPPTVLLSTSTADSSPHPPDATLAHP
jgi:hypothetical protein